MRRELDAERLMALSLTYQTHHFFLGLSWHDSLIAAGPIPVPAKLPHITGNWMNGFLSLLKVPALMGTTSHAYVKNYVFGGEVGGDAPDVRGPYEWPFMVRGTDCGFLSPHVSIPINNWLLPITILFGGSTSVFGASSVKLQGYTVLFPPDDGDITCGIIPWSPVNLALGCNDWCPVPLDFKITWSSVMVGVSWQDYVAALIDVVIEIALAGLGEWGGKKLGKKFGKAADSGALSPAEKAAKEGLSGTVVKRTKVGGAAATEAALKAASKDAADKAAKEAADKAAKEAAEKAAKEAAEKAAKEAADKAAEKAAAEAAEKAANDAARKAANEAGGQAADKATAQAAERAAEQAINEAGQKSAQRAAAEAAEKAAKEAADKAAKEAADAAAEKAAKEAADKAAKEAAEKAAKEATQKTADKTAAEAADKAAEEAAEKAAKEAAEKAGETTAAEASEKIAKEAADHAKQMSDAAEEGVFWTGELGKAFGRHFVEEGVFLAPKYYIGKGLDDAYKEMNFHGDQGHPEPTVAPDGQLLGVQGDDIEPSLDDADNIARNRWSTNAAVVPMKITFSRPRDRRTFNTEERTGELSGFTASDLGLEGCSVSNWLQRDDGYEYTFQLTPTGSRCTLNIDEDKCFRHDNDYDLKFPNKAATPCVIEFIGAANAPVLSTSTGQETAAGRVTTEERIDMTVRFTNAVEGFESSKVGVSTGSRIDQGTWLEVSQREYTFQIQTQGPGDVEAQVNDKAATEVTSRGKTSRSALFRITRVAQSLTADITRRSPSTSVSPIPLRVQFDRPVPAFEAEQILLTGATLVPDSLTPSGAAGYDFQVVPLSDGNTPGTDVTVQIAAGSVTDDIGRTLASPAELVTRYEPAPGDVVIQQDGEMLSSEFPGLDPEDLETLKQGMEMLNSAAQEVPTP
jgi:chemotaxis protein histidine kinase CheA